MANEKTFRFVLLSPERKISEREARNVIFRAETGDIGILPGHEPLITTLAYGALRAFYGEEDEEVFAVFGGFAEMNDNVLTILADAAERADEIDAARARASVELHAREKAERTDELEIRKAELALRRAQVRLEVSSYPIIQGHHGNS
ncbi:ATP synthase epsilon chain [Clostridia bacterium]|nr:ATP synthase epsilon chain [Clostridia bacterium]